MDAAWGLDVVDAVAVLKQTRRLEQRGHTVAQWIDSNLRLAGS